MQPLVSIPIFSFTEQRDWNDGGGRGGNNLQLGSHQWADGDASAASPLLQLGSQRHNGTERSMHDSSQTVLFGIAFLVGCIHEILTLWEGGRAT